MATYSVYCSDSLDPVKFDSLGASIEAACRLIQGGKIISCGLWARRDSDGTRRHRRGMLEARKQCAIEPQLHDASIKDCQASLAATLIA